MAKFFTQTDGRLPIELIDDLQTVAIARIFTSIGSVGVALSPLHAFALPPNILNVNGKSLRIISQGLFGGAAGTKRLALNQGANIVIDVAGIASNNVGWKMVTDFMRLSSTLCVVTASLFPSAGYGGGSFTAIYQGQNNHNVDYTTALNFNYQAQAANGADTITQFSTIATVF